MIWVLLTEELGKHGRSVGGITGIAVLLGKDTWRAVNQSPMGLASCVLKTSKDGDYQGDIISLSSLL